MENKLYDLIIIGGGPAGSAGAVYASRKKLKTLLITYTFGGQSTDSSDIQNWIGTPSISGADLAKSLETHVRTYADDVLDILSGENVTGVSEVDGSFQVATDANKKYTAKTVLVTSGSGRRKLEVPGAKELEHKGITYCASCDGLLFQGMDVAVIGGGNAGFETAAQLLAYTKSVTLFNRGESFRADEITVEKVLANPKMTALKNVDLISIEGDKFVSGIKYKDMATNEEKTISVQGIFVEIGQIPNTDIVKGFLNLDQYGKVITDPMIQRTSVKGVWAAGDCTDGLYHQNNIATGDAVKALEDIYLYLHAGK